MTSIRDTIIKDTCAWNVSNRRQMFAIKNAHTSSEMRERFFRQI